MKTTSNKRRSRAKKDLLSEDDPRWQTLAVLLSNALSINQLYRLLRQSRDLRAVMAEGSQAIARNAGVSEQAADRLLRRLDDPDLRIEALREIERLDRHQVHLITQHDLSYPSAMRASTESPPVLFLWGEFLPEDAHGLAILGSAKCTPYGAAQARHFAHACSADGITIVTGGEVGIDAAANQAAIEANGRTVVLLGAGLFAHGRAHHHLYEQISGAGRGCVISAVPTMTPPRRDNQIAGDWMAAGFSRAMLIIEASENSGSLIAARIMREVWNKPVFAIPGRINDKNSVGTNRLIATGRANMATGPKELLKLIGH